ncbi:hypothetical protein [Constantimarinum furrinae]|uniref:Uncharacterized protein n=1 Tax=Constantimarinum furrinae TaxID=2562285 RepID=A0A7G8PWQ5_9FLAO|nr:hypothetical protein [Constantimarinum furrinae]QNJ98771.1 hypothetical protein ALE3EI_2226 [Constantimarinum furrinae]
MKRIITLLILCIGLQASAQDLYLQHDSDKFEEEAQEIMQRFDAELALTSKQELLFQKKIEEFLIRRNEVNSSYTGQERLDQLLILQTNQTAEMGDILTRIQLDRYKQVQPSIQPLAEVKQ